MLEGIRITFFMLYLIPDYEAELDGETRSTNRRVKTLTVTNTNRHLQ